MTDKEIAMKNRSLGLSLRYKLLIVLTVIPITVLALYLFMATALFKEDKLAYVYESSVSVAASLSTQVKLEVETFLDKVKPILEEYDFSKRDFTLLGHDLFARQWRIQALLLFQRTNPGEYIPIGRMAKATGFEGPFLNDDDLIHRVRTNAVEYEIVMQGYHTTGKHVVIGHRFGRVEDPDHKVLVALVDADDLMDAFAKSTLYRNFLLDPRGKLAIGPGSLEEFGLLAEDFENFFAPIVESELPRGTVEVGTIAGRKVLISYTDARVGGMVLVSVVDKDAALEAVGQLISKSILFFVALIATTVIISVFASISLTSTLRELYDATLKIAQGRFDVRVKRRSTDEVGGLAESFNWMAGEVSRLLSETAQKARMESELATVKTVQETLFPPGQSKFGPLHIAGHFEPATECGGDWWNYSQMGDKVYLWIGDATGHGAPAALITSAAKSASSVIEMFPDMSPGKAMAIMNNAIYETSKARIMMTFFLACIDLKTGKMTYANASHDPPYLIRAPGRAPTKKDMTPLIDANGPRLGENRDSTYSEVEVQLEKNDLIVFYTDGVIDVRNQGGKPLGERQFIKSLIESASSGSSIEQKMSRLKEILIGYREQTELVDDVTLFMCQYEDVA